MPFTLKLMKSPYAGWAVNILTLVYIRRKISMGIFAMDGKFARVMNTLGSLFVLNILTLLCCIPVITAGAAMTALYTMTLRMVHREEGKIIREYFEAFRKNFRQATILWGIFGGLILFISFDIWLLQRISGGFGQAYRILLFLLILAFAMELIHIFAVLARFDNTTKRTAYNALLFIAGHFPAAILMLALTISPLLLLSVSYRFIPVLFLLGLSGPAYLAGIYFQSIFRRYEGKGEPADDSSLQA